MAEAEIVRTQVIVVKKVWEDKINGYPYFLWTDEKDKEYKVKEGRADFFRRVVEPNAAVQLNYASYKGKEYVYSAEEVKEKLPTSTPKDTKLEALKEEQIRKGEPRTLSTAWGGRADPQRKSIERQTALKAATELAQKMVGASPQTIVMDAKIFEDYLEFGYVREPGRLVEEAKELGDKEDIPF